MMYSFAKTSRGYYHKRLDKPCQDYSINYVDKDKVIIATCDGHGGDSYIRSKKGSELACNAILEVFNSLTKLDIKRCKSEPYLDSIKLKILCAWNRLVEKDVSSNPFKKKEFELLDEDKEFDIRHNSSKAYGTTMTGALLMHDKLIIVSIGDSEPFLVKKGAISKVFDDIDEPVANITYSMCQEDAYAHLKIKMVDFKQYDAIIMGTDGLTSPYQSYDNFNNNFVKPLMNKILVNNDLKYIDNFVDDLASGLGTGDDVSLAFIINSKAYRKYYR